MCAHAVVCDRDFHEELGCQESAKYWDIELLLVQKFRFGATYRPKEHLSDCFPHLDHCDQREVLGFEVAFKEGTSKEKNGETVDGARRPI